MKVAEDQYPTLPVLLSELPTREEFPKEPPTPTKSEKFWSVSSESEEGTPDCDLRDCFEQAREELGFDRHEDVYFRKIESAVKHAERVLTLYSERVGGTVTSEILSQIREELGCAENDVITLEWCAVGEPTLPEVKFLPNFVRLLQGYEVRALGFREEFVVVDGHTYSRKVETRTEWRAAPPHEFLLWVYNLRVSLGN